MKIQYVIESSDFQKDFEGHSFDRGKDRSFGLRLQSCIRELQKVVLAICGWKDTNLKSLEK